MEGNAERLGDVSGIYAIRIGLVIEAVRRRFPELDVVAELRLLLVSEISDGRLDLDPRHFGRSLLALCRLRSVFRRGGWGIVFRVATSVYDGGLCRVLPSEEIMLIDRWLTVEAVRPK